MDLAVSYFVPEHPAIPLTVRNLLREHQTEKIHQLMNAMDWPDTCYRKGYIDGLKYAIGMCEEIEKNLNR